MSQAIRPVLFILTFGALGACDIYTGTPLDSPRAWWFNFLSEYAPIIFILGFSIVGWAIYISITHGSGGTIANGSTVWEQCWWPSHHIFPAWNTTRPKTNLNVAEMHEDGSLSHVERDGLKTRKWPASIRPLAGNNEKL